MEEEEMSECKGCINIKNESFPFGRINWHQDKRFFFAIDTEGCGSYDTNADGKELGLIIYYCPVCGKKLKEAK